MLPNLLDKIKAQQYPIFLALCIGLISFISYNLGRISSVGQEPLKIRENASIFNAVSEEGEAGEGITASPGPKRILDTRVVVSKASTTKKYHYTWCPGAKQIKEENKIWFSSDKEAEINGYTLAGNCIK